LQSSRKGSAQQNVATPKVTISNPIANTINPIVDARIPSFNYNYPTVGSPLINLLNPTVGVPATAHVSYIQQMPATMSAAMPMIHGSILGSISSYNGFVPQVPTTYVVGTPVGLPYYSNYNTATAPASAFSTYTQIDDSPRSFVEHNVEPPKEENVGLSLFNSFKKICKKSTKNESPIKTTRDVKNISKLTIEEDKLKEMKKQPIVETVHKEVEQSLSEIHRTLRTTTQRPIMEKLQIQNINLERSTKKNIKDEKTKPGKSIMEKSDMKREKKILNKP
jgi:hypothetical protein